MKRTIFIYLLINMFVNLLANQNNISPPLWLFNDNKFMTYKKFLELSDNPKNLNTFCEYLIRLNFTSQEIKERPKLVSKFFDDCIKDDIGNNYQYYSVFYKFFLFKEDNVNKFKEYSANKKRWRPIEDMPKWMQKEFLSYFDFESSYYSSGNSVLFCDFLSRYVRIYHIKINDIEGEEISYKRISRNQCFDLPFFTRYIYYTHIYNLVIQKENLVDTYDIPNASKTIRQTKYYSVKY